MSFYVKPLEKLIDEFERMPGIGHKSAVRLAFYVLNMTNNQAKGFVNAIVDAKTHIKYCSICKNITDKDPCAICSNQKRDKSIICVVEHPKDVLAIERMKDFSGLYHILHGVISPMDGIGPENIEIKSLISRIDESVDEVILATNTSIEGEATAMYIARVIKPLGIKVSRIAHGIPVGGDLEYADEITLSKAMEGRRQL